MLLDFNGSKIPVNVSEEKSTLSKHTGASLDVLEVWTSVRGRMASDELLSLIDRAKADGIVVSIDDHSKIEKRWKIGKTSWSYRDGDPIYTHSITLTEVEELNLTSLTLGDITVQPYEYEEGFSSDRLRIDAKVALTEAEHLQLKDMQMNRDDFPVIRHGIDESPRQMRFGICYWSQHEGGYKHDLFIVDEDEDKSSDALAKTFQWMRTMRNQVAENTAAIDLLLTTLVNKGRLTEDEVANIRKEISEHSEDVQYGFWRVEDVDEM